LNVKLSKEAAEFISSSEITNLLDSGTLDRLASIGSGAKFTLDPSDVLGPVDPPILPRVPSAPWPELWPDDGPRFPIPRPEPGLNPFPNNPFEPDPVDPLGPYPIDPYGPYAGIGTASVIIAVAIGVVLAINTDRVAGDTVIDYSGLDRL